MMTVIARAVSCCPSSGEHSLSQECCRLESVSDYLFPVTEIENHYWHWTSTCTQPWNSQVNIGGTFVVVPYQG
jgi:hypothetical protein